MKPKINVLELVNGEMKSVYREMTEEEYTEYLDAVNMAEESNAEEE